jgi:Uma2 family endonuclease
MTTPPRPRVSPHCEIPIGPSIETWQAMSATARETFFVEVFRALTDLNETMGEGRPHKTARLRIVDFLSLHFKALGRTVYLAEEMSVVYPDEPVFAPDVMAVVDVPQVEDDERMGWVVADEGRGLDVVFEVLHQGDRDKDLVYNVERYAHLGIAEYFVYDRANQRVHGFRLAPNQSGVRRYQKIVPHAGRYHSQLLGIDLAVQQGTLRFFQGMAELFGSDNLIGRLQRVINDLEAKAEAKSEATRAAAEATRATEEAARASAATVGLQLGVLALFESRFGPCADELRARVLSCSDPAILQRWLLATINATTLGDIAW